MDYVMCKGCGTEVRMSYAISITTPPSIEDDVQYSSKHWWCTDCYQKARRAIRPVAPAAMVLEDGTRVEGVTSKETLIQDRFDLSNRTIRLARDIKTTINKMSLIAQAAGIPGEKYLKATWEEFESMLHVLDNFDRAHRKELVDLGVARAKDVSGLFGQGNTYLQLVDSIKKGAREVNQLIGEKNNAYTERDKCVALIARMAQNLGYTVYRSEHPDTDKDWDRMWRWIVFIDLPTGQVSWHIHLYELPWFEDLPVVLGTMWDGHTTEEKYRRVLAYQKEKSV